LSGGFHATDLTGVRWYCSASPHTARVINLIKSLYRNMMAFTSFILAKPPTARFVGHFSSGGAGALRISYLCLGVCQIRPEYDMHPMTAMNVLKSIN
jgi:hypothetical protein